MILFIIIIILAINLFVTPLRQRLFWWIQQVFSRRIKVDAVLVSKVDSKYEDKMSVGLLMGDLGRIHGHADAVNEAHWLRKAIPVSILIFDVGGRNIELAVEREIFDRYEEKDIGILDYKGHKFYGFKKTQRESLKERLSDRMGTVEFTTWIARRKSYDILKHSLKQLLVLSLIILFCVSRILAIRESQKMHQRISENYPVIEIELERLDSATRKSISWYHEVHDGKLSVYYDEKLGNKLPVIRPFIWTGVYIFYGVIISTLGARIIYIIYRLIRSWIARRELMS